MSSTCLPRFFSVDSSEWWPLCLWLFSMLLQQQVLHVCLWEHIGLMAGRQSHFIVCVCRTPGTPHRETPRPCTRPGWIILMKPNFGHCSKSQCCSWRTYYQQGWCKSMFTHCYRKHFGVHILTLPRKVDCCGKLPHSERGHFAWNTRVRWNDLGSRTFNYLEICRTCMNVWTVSNVLNRHLWEPRPTSTSKTDKTTLWSDLNPVRNHLIKVDTFFFGLVSTGSCEKCLSI